MTRVRVRWRRVRRAAGNALDAAGLLGPFYRLRRRWVAARAPMRRGGEYAGLPMPPARLRVMVDSGGDPQRFHRVGALNRDTILRTLERAGTEIASLGSILDFGCGCGRVARHWANLDGPELHGCDYNPELVDWCRANLEFMEARVNGLEPPLPYESASFDLVYAISVLTHLTEPLATAWLDELARVVRPGGLLLVTTHGKLHRDGIPPRSRAAFDRGELVVARRRLPGTNACAAFHPRAYMEAQLASRFDSVAFYGDGANLPFHQDVYLARAPLSPGR
ncbi:MAG TPA: class I SAM-dependent methyltransferase [Thermoleophilaceae bacterium]|nr:class I SAM-dependent methyltransferase [Thermoleophilaceae bacterium]